MLYPPDTPDGLPDPQFQPDFYAGVVSKRLLAWVIDMVVVLAILVAIGLATGFIGFFFFPLLWPVVDIGYRIVTLARNSATLGMRVMGLEIRDRRGAPLDSAHAGLHTLGYLVSMSVFPAQIVSVVLMLTSARKQGLSDHVLGTAAINRPAAAS